MTAKKGRVAKTGVGSKKEEVAKTEGDIKREWISKRGYQKEKVAVKMG